MTTITNSYIWMRQVLIWPRQGGEVGISLASGQPSKYLDNMGPTLPCVRLYQKMVCVCVCVSVCVCVCVCVCVVETSQIKCRKDSIF